MFKKRIRISAIIFSVFLMMMLGVVLINNEFDIHNSKKDQVINIIQENKRATDIIWKWSRICSLKENSLLKIDNFVNNVIENTDFQRHNIMYFPEDKTYGIWDYWDTLGQDPDVAFRRATPKEALAFYKNEMLGLAQIFPGFSLWYYLMRFLFVLGLSAIPSVLSFLSSFLVFTPVISLATSVCLLFVMIIGSQVQADTTVIKFATSTVGDTHSLSFGMLNLGNRTGEILLLTQKGIRGAYGPVFKFSKGMIFSPIGVICGKGEKGVRIEYLSLWHVSNLQFGKLNHVVMGSYNHPIVKDKSPFAAFKETLYYTVSKLRPGIRIDYLFQKAKKWKSKISIGPTLQFIKEKFSFHIHASLTRPYTIKTEWQISF